MQQNAGNMQNPVFIQNFLCYGMDVVIYFNQMRMIDKWR